MGFQGLHPCRIETSHLGGKLLQLGGGKATQDVVGQLVSGELRMVVDQGFEMGQRRTTGVELEGIPGGGARLGSRRGPQPIDLLATLCIQGVIDLRVEATADLGAPMSSPRFTFDETTASAHSLQGPLTQHWLWCVSIGVPLR
jgi:hypothetical protein